MSRPLLNLVIPDVHLKMDTVQRILDRESYDKVYFLGDFFDDWNDKAATNAKMAQKLNDWMENDDFHFIYGNHDVHYFWDLDFLPCSGYEEIKHLAIKNFLNRDLVRKRFKFYQTVDDWLLTHSGCDRRVIPNDVKEELRAVVEYLERQTETCKNQLSMGRSHWFFQAGYARGGRYPVGGILWCDWFDEFRPIPNVKQIAGHTFCGSNGKQNVPHWRDGYNVNLDTNLKYYGIVKGGELEIKRTLDII